MGLKIKKEFAGSIITDQRGTFDAPMINGLPANLRQVKLQAKIDQGFGDYIHECDCPDHIETLDNGKDCDCKGKKISEAGATAVKLNTKKQSKPKPVDMDDRKQIKDKDDELDSKFDEAMKKAQIKEKDDDLDSEFDKAMKKTQRYIKKRKKS